MLNQRFIAADKNKSALPLESKHSTSISRLDNTILTFCLACPETQHTINVLLLLKFPECIALHFPRVRVFIQLKAVLLYKIEYRLLTFDFFLGVCYISYMPNDVTFVT